MVRNIISGRGFLRGFSRVMGRETGNAACSSSCPLRLVSRRSQVRAKGFTLVELLIVMSLMGILASIAIPTYNKSVIRAREATLRKDLYHMREAIDRFYGDHEIYPDSLDELVEKGYIRVVPVDPLTGDSDSWVEIPSNDNSGIFDVVSGSEESGRDGMAYSEW